MYCTGIGQKQTEGMGGSIGMGEIRQMCLRSFPCNCEKKAPLSKRLAGIFLHKRE